RPDFLTIRNKNSKAWVEAVVTQPTMGSTAQPKSKEEFGELTTIKIGNALLAKLSKQYFKLHHVSGRPLFFALSEFHNSQPYRNPGHFLVEYVYGFRMIAMDPH